MASPVPSAQNPDTREAFEPSELVQPTAAELGTLELHISNWQDRTPIEQAICLGVLRGHCYPSQITKYLGMDVGDFEQALPVLLKNGLVRGKRDRLLLR